MMYLFYAVFLFCGHLSKAWIFQDQNENFSNFTSKMKISLTGYMVAFGDFNSDRATDIFVLDNDNSGQRLDVILMKKDAQKTAKRITLLQNLTYNISGVIVGDFDGDSILDLIIYREVNQSYSVEIAYGNPTRNGVSALQSITNGFTLTTPPLHLDWNADMRGDLFGQLPNNTMIVMYGNTNKNFTYELQPQLSSSIDTLLYSKFADVNGDSQADVLLIGVKNDGGVNKVAMTTFLKIAGRFQPGTTITIGNNTVLVGQGVIGDFQMSGRLQMVVPMCRDLQCADSYLIVCALGSADLSCQENPLPVAAGVRLVPGSKVHRLSLKSPQVASMSCGDLHLSGRLECLLLVTTATNSPERDVLILSAAANGTTSTRRPEGDAGLYRNLSQVAIFDLLEDGIPDILTARREGVSGAICPLLHESSNDQYFIKVMVLNGMCNSPPTCPGNLLPFGIPLPGISVAYTTEAANGGTQSAVASICPDSAYSSLQLPYTIFGLGPFANYVEKLTVNLPSANITRKHVLTFIVPKTQIVIIPYPLDEPSKWTYKLFLEPFHNMKVIYVAAALLGTFLIVAIITCILQYLEVRVDRLEKQQEAQKFHFDAM